MSHHVADLYALTKPRIVALLCLTGVSALLAAGGAPPLELLAFVVAGATIAAGSAALNCWYDRDLDRQMARTADRPLPQGSLSPWTAAAFAGGLLAVGTGVGLVALPAKSVGYMWLGVAAYVGLYTVGLKRRHPLGVVLGGSAGAFPVLAGWSAVRPVGLSSLAMAALVFVWTPAHAWALAMVYRDDFAGAGIPTLPVVASLARTRRAVWWATLLTAALSLALAPVLGAVYAVTAIVATGHFLAAAWRVRRVGTAPTAVRAFFTSNAFLGALFVAWAVGGLVAEPSIPALALLAVAVGAGFGALWRARLSLGGVATDPVTTPTPSRAPPEAE